MTSNHGATRRDRETARNFTDDLSVVHLDDRTVTLGPRCRNCGSTEARCARVGGCCQDGCTHFGPRLFLIAATAKGGTPRTACADCRRIRRACPHGGAA